MFPFEILDLHLCLLVIIIFTTAPRGGFFYPYHKKGFIYPLEDVLIVVKSFSMTVAYTK